MSLVCSHSEYLKLERPLPPTLVRCLDATDILDQQVWDTAARWSGLKEFGALYQTPALQKLNLETLIFLIPSENELNAMPPVAIVDLLKRSDDGALDLNYPRFYTTLTGIWLAVEGWKLMNASYYPLASTYVDHYKRVRKFFTERNTLREFLEALELYDFLYVFILFRIPCLAI